MLGNNFMQFVHILIIPLGKRKYDVFFFYKMQMKLFPDFTRYHLVTYFIFCHE